MIYGRLSTAILLLLALSATCFGSDYQYKVYYHTKGDSACGTKMIVGSNPEATNGFDFEHPWAGSTPDGVLIGIHNTNGVDGWSGNTGFYVDDYRPTPTQGNTITISNIYVWANVGVASQNMHLYLDSAPRIGTDATCKLSLVSVPSGVTYNGPTEWSLPHGDIVLPFYSTSDGMTSYKFKIEITAAQ
ncbi:MAG: hypothetical protein ACYC64_06615 [Armatimonadota bacterium]